MHTHPKLLAPAGNDESLQAAIQGGCDAVYFGVEALNMRAKNTVTFSLSEINRVAGQCRKAGIQSYLTLNTVLYDHELDQARQIIDTAKQSGINGVIVSDMAALLYCHQQGLEAHISTQLSVSNLESVLFFSQYADRIVLARELSLAQVAHITREIQTRQLTGPAGRLLEIELFAHGAMCVAVSGRCAMSLYLHNASANRGQCLQPCRRQYRVMDTEDNLELVLNNNYVMSPKDLNTIHILDKIAASGVSVLKIEGRTRSAEYVYWVTKAYRSALDALVAGTYSPALTQSLEQDLKKIYHRGYAEGFYLGMDSSQWSGKHGSHATHRKVYCGKVLNYYPKAFAAWVKIEACDLANGDEIIIIGPTTGVVTFKLEGMQKEDKPICRAKPGEDVTFKVPKRIRTNDRVHIFRAIPPTL
ncbi:U32 family peptidase [bacterium]|nr:U32 family peptidase [bacterium]